MIEHRLRYSSLLSYSEILEPVPKFDSLPLNPHRTGPQVLSTDKLRSSLHKLGFLLSRQHRTATQRKTGSAPFRSAGLSWLCYAHGRWRAVGRCAADLRE